MHAILHEIFHAIFDLVKHCIPVILKFFRSPSDESVFMIVKYYGNTALRIVLTKPVQCEIWILNYSALTKLDRFASSKKCFVRQNINKIIYCNKNLWSTINIVSWSFIWKSCSMLSAQFRHLMCKIITNVSISIKKFEIIYLIQTLITIYVICSVKCLPRY